MKSGRIGIAGAALLLLAACSSPPREAAAPPPDLGALPPPGIEAGEIEAGEIEAGGIEAGGIEAEPAAADFSKKFWKKRASFCLPPTWRSSFCAISSKVPSPRFR